MAQLSCRGVTLGYEGRAVVEDLSFEVNAGDFLCVVGENGSGKSTLIKALLKLKEPMKGEILTGDGLKQTEIGYLPQQTVVQRDFPASVGEIVLSGCLNRLGHRLFYSGEERRLAGSAMEKLGVSELSRRCYRELSGGQQQRVLLARALCATRRMLLLDEPVAGLDPAASAELYRVIQSLNRDDGITVIMVSHDIAAALTYATHVLHVSHRPLFFGTAADYRDSGALRRYVPEKGGEL